MLPGILDATFVYYSRKLTVAQGKLVRRSSDHMPNQSDQLPVDAAGEET